MSVIEATLATLGVTLPDLDHAPKAAGNYLPFVVVGNLVYVSGQISQNENGLITGKLGADVSVSQGAEAAKACAISLLTQLKVAVNGDMDRLVRVVKLTGFVNSTADFVDQPKVINGASDFFVAALGDKGMHARAAVSAASLPLGVAVEIEAVFEISDRIKLPDTFLERPICHRGLHDVSKGRAENSPKAIQAAIDAGYAVEIDLQISSDGVPMVFHDYVLFRLTEREGTVALHTAAQLAAMPLRHDGDGIPTLAEVLKLVNGQVPLLIEIKDQDGKLGRNIGPLGGAIADALADYAGPVAVMSFNPHAVAEMQNLLPKVPRGLTTGAVYSVNWPKVPVEVLDTLAAIPDYDRVGASFISHWQAELDTPCISALKAQGAKVLCWTVKSQQMETAARKFADNITFEGYLA